MKKAVQKFIRAVCLDTALVAAMALASSAAIAQTTLAPGVQIPAEAKKGVLEAGDDGQITLDGKPARLSAAAQIRGTNNLIVLSQSLHGKYNVRVVLDNAGLIHRAWILNPQ